MQALRSLIRPALAGLLMATAGLAQAQSWQLVWSDEFNGSIGPNWAFETGAGGWGNNELQYYRRENATVENGVLVITARRENFGGAAYTSARMKTQGLKTFKFGRIEARMKLPSFLGAWPAFWMLGANLPQVGWPASGEIDVMEHVNDENKVYGTIHWQDNTGQHAQYGGNLATTVTDWHVYAVEWDASTIRWMIDGTKYHEASIANGVNGTDEFQKDFFLLLNFSIGGDWPGFNVNNAALPARMEVDYVRVYAPAAAGVATVYQNCNYGGYAAALPEGSYTLAQLRARGVSDNDLSSLRVNAGYQVQLFDGDNFTGSSVNRSGDTGCLVDQAFDNRASSVIVSKIPPWSRQIEAEAFSAQAGVQTEACSEGGQNVGWIDTSDWMAYNSVNFPSSGSYRVEYRVASVGGGTLSLDLNGGSIALGQLGVPATGGWQNWTTISHTVNINAGTYNVGVFAAQGGWNLNWIRFTKL